MKKVILAIVMVASIVTTKAQLSGQEKAELAARELDSIHAAQTLMRSNETIKIGMTKGDVISIKGMPQHQSSTVTTNEDSIMMFYDDITINLQHSIEKLDYVVDWIHKIEK